MTHEFDTKADKDERQVNRLCKSFRHIKRLSKSYRKKGASSVHRQKAQERNKRGLKVAHIGDKMQDSWTKHTKDAKNKNFYEAA